MLNTDSTATDQPMYRDRLQQHRQSDPRFIETADSFARALDANRRQRAEFLELMFALDSDGFDVYFADNFAADSAIVFFLSDDAAKRGLSMIQPKDVQ
jgi:hypothetical protein